MAEPIRLADLLAGLSLVSDLGFGLPPEQAMRRCVLATALARRIDLDEGAVADVYWTALLQHIGCTGFAHETAAVYGDELALNAAVVRMDPASPRDALGFVRAATAGLPLGRRVGGIAFSIVRGGEFGRQFATSTCEVGRETARRLGLGEGVRRGLQDVVEDWNGKGGARGLRGDEIGLAARITAVASTAALFSDAGEEAAVEAVRRRAGGLLDPELAAAFVEWRGDIFGELRERDPRDAALDAEPGAARVIGETEMVEVAAAIGDIADLKTPALLGHSGGVAALAVAAGEHSGLDDAARTELEIAALLHDVGRVGISNAIWERRGPLTHAEWEQVRLHPYHAERILARSDALSGVARVAGMHHERLDGSGYHRGARGREIGQAALVLAAADAFDAMTHDRPYRAAMTRDQAASRLTDEASAGRLDPVAVDAVTSAAGMPSEGRARVERPAGLSEREVEVLRLVARGLSNPEIAGALDVSRRTAEHHVQHIYDKIGASSRAAAALFAMEHALLD